MLEGMFATYADDNLDLFTKTDAYVEIAEPVTEAYNEAASQYNEFVC